MTTELLPCPLTEREKREVITTINAMHHPNQNGQWADWWLKFLMWAKLSLEADARPARSPDAVALSRKLAHRINNSIMLRLTTFEPMRPNGLDEGMLANTILEVLEAFRQQVYGEAIASCGGAKVSASIALDIMMLDRNKDRASALREAVDILNALVAHERKQTWAEATRAASKLAVDFKLDTSGMTADESAVQTAHQIACELAALTPLERKEGSGSFARIEKNIAMTPHDQSARNLADKLAAMTRSECMIDGRALITQALRTAHDAGVKEGRELAFKEATEWNDGMNI